MMGFGGGFSAGNGHPIEELEAEWSKMGPVLPEYESALKTSCLQRAWFCRTKVQRYYRSMAADFAEDPWLPKLLLDQGHYEALVLRLIQKGFGLTTEGPAMCQKDLVCDECIFEAFRKLYNIAGSRKAYLTYAVQIMLDMERPEIISAKISGVCDRASRCLPAQQQALHMLVLHCYQLKHKTKADEVSLDTEQGALARFNEIMEDYLDDHKDNAFKSAFTEPARLCCMAFGDHGGHDNVTAHGLNWYLALLHSALGVQMSMVPSYDDGGCLGVVDFWVGLKDLAWKSFSDPRNFGTSYEGIASLKNADVVQRRVNTGELPEGLRTSKPSDLGLVASGKINDHRWHCEGLALYLQRFAFFFSRDFFLPKAFGILNSEVKEEHKGFTKVCERLFKSYKKEMGVSEDSVLEHLYNEEYELDVERVHRFFAWLGVVQHDKVQPHFPLPDWPGTGSSNETSAAHPSSTTAHSAPENTVQPDPKNVREALRGLLHPAEPFEQEPPPEQTPEEHITPLQQLHTPFPPPQSDEDDAELQAAIRASLEQHEKDQQLAAALTATPKESDVDHGSEGGCNSEPWVQEHTALILRTLSEVSRQMNPDERASAFEPWAICELTYGVGVKQLAKALVESEHFAWLLDEALRSRSEWVRDAAAIFFRLSGMYREGELAVNEAQGKSLAEAVELILEPSERNEPVKLPGQFYGALYTQALTALFSARMSEEALTNELQALVRRTGAAVVHSYDKHQHPGLKEQIKERLPLDYADISAAVWGSREADVVWQRLYA